MNNMSNMNKMNKNKNKSKMQKNKNYSNHKNKNYSNHKNKKSLKSKQQGGKKKSGNKSSKKKKPVNKFFALRSKHLKAGSASFEYGGNKYVRFQMGKAKIHSFRRA